MAKFNVDVSPAQGAGAQPLAPVASTSHIDERPVIMQGVLGVAQLFMANEATKREEEKKARQEAIVGDYIKNLTNLNDLVDRGVIKPHEAAMRQRAITSQTFAAYPALHKEIGEAGKIVAGGTELGQFSAEEQAAKELDRKLDQDMSAAGYNIYLGMDPKVKASHKATFQAAREADAKFKRFAEQKAFANTQDAANRASTEFSLKLEAGRELSRVGNANIDDVTILVSSLVGKDPVKSRVELGAHMSRIYASIADAAQFAPESASAWRLAFQELEKTGIDVIENKIPKERIANELQMVRDRNALAALRVSPSLGKMDVLSRLTKPTITGGVQSEQMMAQVFNDFTALPEWRDKSAPPVPPVVAGENKDMEKGILSGLRDNIRSFIDGKVLPRDQETTGKQIKVGLDNVIKQTRDATFLRKEPKALNSVLDFIGSPEFKQAREKGLVDDNQLKELSSVMVGYYNKEVADTVVKTLEKPFQNGKYSDLVALEIVGGHVVLKANPKLRDANMASQVIREGQDAVQALNRVIRAGANMEGSTTDQYWKTVRPLLFPQYYGEEAAKGGVEVLGAPAINVTKSETGKKISESAGNPWWVKK